MVALPHLRGQQPVTGLQLGVLMQTCRLGVLPGAALLFLHQAGRNRQVNFLIKRKMARKRGGRLVATRHGRGVYHFHRGPEALDQAERGHP